VSAVLCIAEDGHIHAEKAVGLKCDRSVSELNSESHTAHSEGESCRDFPLPFGSVQNNASLLQFRVPAALVSAEIVAFLPNLNAVDVFKTFEYALVANKRASQVPVKPPLVLRI